MNFVDYSKNINYIQNMSNIPPELLDTIIGCAGAVLGWLIRHLFGSPAGKK